MKKLACLLAFMFVFCGVSQAQAQTGIEGILYTDVTKPVSTAEQTKYSSKKGESTCYNVLGLVAWGKCGLQDAMKEGNISQVHHTDQYVNGWIFFKKIKTQVYGY